MISLAELTKTVYEIIDQDEYYSDFTKERGETIPDNDPQACPWIGVFRKRANYNPQSIGYSVQSGDTDNWRGEIELAIVILESNQNNVDGGGKTEDALEEHVKHTIELLFSNTTLQNKVDMIKTLSVTYTYNEYDSETIYIQGAVINFTLVVVQS